MPRINPEDAWGILWNTAPEEVISTESIDVSVSPSDVSSYDINLLLSRYARLTRRGEIDEVGPIPDITLDSLGNTRLLNIEPAPICRLEYYIKQDTGERRADWLIFEKEDNKEPTIVSRHSSYTRAKRKLLRIREEGRYYPF